MILRSSFATVLALGVLVYNAEIAFTDEPKRDTDAESKLTEHLKDLNRFEEPDGSYEILFVESKKLGLTKPVILIKNKDKSIKQVIRAETAMIRIFADGKAYLCVDHAFIFSNDSFAEVRNQEWEITKPVLPKKK